MSFGTSDDYYPPLDDGGVDNEGGGGGISLYGGFEGIGGGGPYGPGPSGMPEPGAALGMDTGTKKTSPYDVGVSDPALAEIARQRRS